MADISGPSRPALVWLLVNAPVVWLGARATRRLPLRVVHSVSALVFAVLGVLALLVPA